MTGPDPAAFAELLAGYCLDVQPGHTVLVRSTPLAAPLLLELQRTILRRGAWPLLRAGLPGEGAGFLAHARDEQLDAPAPAALAEAAAVDAWLSIDAPANTRALAGADPKRLARLGRGQRALRDTRLARRWCTTLWPTDALAQQAGMSLERYAAFVRGALFLDRPDPVVAWGELRALQDGLIARLRGARVIRVEAEGTDLTLRVDGRTWVNSDGRRNMPSGEVFTGPLEDSAEGTIRFTVPSNRGGAEVAGAELTFRAGEVVAARAGRGEDELRAALSTDAGARRLGELGIGTNTGIDRPVGSTLLDEKMGGTIHLALGSSYPETGGTNDSALHWDLVCDLRAGGRLSADGEPVVEDGRVVA